MADVFDKCHQSDFHAVRELRESGNTFTSGNPIPQDAEVIVGGRRVIMVGSNNYLGLTCHPRVKEATIKAVETYAPGCGRLQVLEGNLSP